MNLPRLPEFSALTKRQWAILGGGAAALAAVLIAVGVAVCRHHRQRHSSAGLDRKSVV